MTTRVAWRLCNTLCSLLGAQWKYETNSFYREQQLALTCISSVSRNVIVNVSEMLDVLNPETHYLIFFSLHQTRYDKHLNVEQAEFGGFSLRVLSFSSFLWWHVTAH